LLVEFSDETMRATSIPFQQVLLLCGRYAGFVTKHCTTARALKDDFVTVESATLGEWVVMPIWHYFMYQLATTLEATATTTTTTRPTGI